MSSAVLYCRPRCAACNGLVRVLERAGVEFIVRDVTAEPDAFETVAHLGYRALPVLVGSDGSAAAGGEATALARRLARAGGSERRHLHHRTVGPQES